MVPHHIRDKLRFLYALKRKDHCVYLVHVPEDQVTKVGRSCHLTHRLKNLRAGIYRDHEVYVIRCASSKESLELEKFLHMALRANHVKGEWYNTVTPEQVQSMLIMPNYGHLLLEPYGKEESVGVSTIKAYSFSVQLS